MSRLDLNTKICYNKTIWSNRKEVVMKHVRPTVLVPVIAALGIGLINATLATPLYAATYTIQQGADAARGSSQPADLFGTSGVFTTISNTLLFIIGALSVVMLIYGGIRYTISGGNSTAVTAAKNTILYAIVGLIIALLAFALINFVLGTLTNPAGGSGFTNT